ncbi:hypothetical protein, partial [Aquitalea magnusonii]|uniref:hypothetical protein n=1 Tax=Aquitalea magnusonii TaxID=332411 RepID=UPI00195F096C
PLARSTVSPARLVTPPSRHRQCHGYSASAGWISSWSFGAQHSLTGAAGHATQSPSTMPRLLGIGGVDF